MKRFRLIFVGFLATLFSSWIGLVFLPVETVGALKAVENPETGETVPPELTDLERRGQQVYIRNGCLYCHSQQVRPVRAGSDIDRGWGQRRTVARDYVNQGRALMGSMRTGPDLSNIGTRQPSETWHLLHLYDPQITSAGSNMPPFRFLFEVKEKGETPRPDALSVSPEHGPGEGLEVIPTDDARALVAYLLSLRYSSQDVPEAERAEVESFAE